MTQWQSQQITLAEDNNLTVVPRENCQIVSETSEQSVTLPYLAYIPESQKLLLLVTCGFPHQVNLMTSDDLGITWSDPRPILPDDPGKRERIAPHPRQPRRLDTPAPPGHFFVVSRFCWTEWEFADKIPTI